MERHMMRYLGDYAITQRPVINLPISEDGVKIYEPKTYQTYFQAILRMASLNLYSETSGIKSTIVPESFI